jgi:hypothetical protein
MIKIPKEIISSYPMKISEMIKCSDVIVDYEKKLNDYDLIQILNNEAKSISKNINHLSRGYHTQLKELINFAWPLIEANVNSVEYKTYDIVYNKSLNEENNYELNNFNINNELYIYRNYWQKLHEIGNASLNFYRTAYINHDDFFIGSSNFLLSFSNNFHPINSINEKYDTYSFNNEIEGYCEAYKENFVYFIKNLKDKAKKLILSAQKYKNEILRINKKVQEKNFSTIISVFIDSLLHNKRLKAFYNSIELNKKILITIWLSFHDYDFIPINEVNVSINKIVTLFKWGIIKWKEKSYLYIKKLVIHGKYMIQILKKMTNQDKLYLEV